MVQNQFIEILLEIGIVGILLFAAIIDGYFRRTYLSKIAWVILIAFLCQMLFFSGYPNSMHVFIIIAFIYAIQSVKESPRTASKNNRKNRLKQNLNIKQ